MRTLRNLGRFFVSAEFFTRMAAPGDGANLFAGMIVLQAEYSMQRDGVEYFGIHADFAVLPEYCQAPFYHPEFEPGQSAPRWML